MPYWCKENTPEFFYYRSKLNDLIEAACTPYVMAIGDFNSDNRAHHKFGKELSTFCKDENLIISDLIHLSNSEYTFVSSHGFTSWIDHVISTYSGHTLINNISVNYRCISSDHLPWMVDLDVSTSRLEQVQHSITKQLVTWDKTNSEDIIKYKNNTSANLSKVHLNHELIMCNNVIAAMIIMLQQLYNDISGAIKESSDFLLSTNTRMEWGG